MEEKIKEIISGFIKIPAGQIGAGTPIGRSALQSSILVHRMYAKLAEQGLVREDYADIKVFSDLWPPHNGTTHRFTAPMASPAEEGPASTGVGIDIEEIQTLPRTDDFRMDEFYQMNFTAREMAYCILQPDPYSSFTGLFAAKEAILKADQGYRRQLFNTIEISHSAEGQPLHAGFQISISHAGTMAVAVAVKGTAAFSAPVTVVPPSSSSSGSAWLVWIAVLVSILALVFALKR